MADTCGALRHGTRYAYKVYRCRCPEAVEKYRIRNRRQQQRGLLLAGPRIRRPEVDEVAVDRACRGEPVTLTLRERAMAVERLTRQGLSARQIAARLRLSARTVQRYRAGEILHAREVA